MSQTLKTPVFNIAVYLISFQIINDISWLITKRNSSRLSSISHKIWSRTNTHHMETCNMAWMSWKSSFFWFLISLYIIFIFAKPYKKHGRWLFWLWFRMASAGEMKHCLKHFMTTTRIFIVCYVDSFIQLPPCPLSNVLYRRVIFCNFFSQFMIAWHFNRSQVKCGPPSIWLINFEFNTLFCGSVSQEFSLTNICFLASWTLSAPEVSTKRYYKSFKSFMINSVNVQKAKLTKAWHDKFWGCHIKVKIQL